MHVLLTGVTGFVGKVVLADLIRRRDEIGLAGVTLVARGKKNRDGSVQTPAERFKDKVAPSQIFADLPAEWLSMITVVAGDLEKDQCGIGDDDLAAIRERITHIIHCAASVEFDLPIAEAARANITSALGVLELARSCKNLVGMVDTSTAYVTPWRDGPIKEVLAHLPRPATELYETMLAGSRPESEFLGETGHANTYTYTKCVAEHLLCERRGDVPLSIVRPSIISTSWKAPFPGWIDSPAALAGALLYTSMGVVPAFLGHPGARLDVVPVDVVSQVIIDAAFVHPFPTPDEQVPIRYAAVGLKKAFRIDTMARTLTDFFRSRPGAKKIDRLFLGTAKHGHTANDVRRRAIPNEALKLTLSLLGQDKDLKRLTRMNDTVQYLNKAFEYFTHHSFDFQPKEACVPASFSPDEYMLVTCRGLYKFLLKKDETEVSLAGAAHDDQSDDVRWAFDKPEGNSAVRALGIGMRKVLRKSTEQVTWDRLSFERAVDQAEPGSIFILAPSHRSYFDFLLMAYVCFQHPELGIPMPHIAAADDFSRIPLVGKILARAGAFYIPRGTGGEVAEVNTQLQKLAAANGSLMFFVEGQRSRSRLTLAPKRGLLRGLQATGRTFTVLPISMSYDRVPEEGALEKELTGGDKPGMSLGAIVGWLSELAKDKVQLGRVHISCGTPLALDENTDVRELSEEIVSELQGNTAATRFHLRTFLKATGLDQQGVSEDWLAKAIIARGGRVLDSKLNAVEKCSPALDQSLRNQWMHVFFADAKAMYPNDEVVDHHIERHGWAPMHDDPQPNDPLVRKVVDALFAPVRADYDLTGRALRDAPSVEKVSAKTIVRGHPKALVPVVEDAFHFFHHTGVLQARPDGGADWGEQADRLAAMLQSWIPTSSSEESTR
ncbi:MAG TPA: SDR family oxidoreductase [Archangium sp.]